MNAAGRFLLPLLLFLCLPSSGLAQTSGEPADSGLVEELVVTASRLAEWDPPVAAPPAHVTVLSREAIEARGVRTLQDLLALESGFDVIDQTGNDVQKTVSLRGFTSGTGLAVFLDGARLNDPRNNSVSLESVPIDAIDRVEIVRGSVSALAGGGSEAGIIHIYTRRGGPPAGRLSAAAGTYGAARYLGEGSGTLGPVDIYASGAIDRSDGFRENAGGESGRWAATAGLDLGEARRLAVSVSGSKLEYGNPGALTSSELALDPRSAPFNRLDHSDQISHRVMLNFQGPVVGGWALSANLFHRDEASETLSTGRAASIWGGFSLDADSAASGSVLQISRGLRSGSTRHHLVVGAEWMRGETEGAGFFTPAAFPGNVDRSSPTSANTSLRRTAALYVQDTWRPAVDWTLTAGARADRDRVRYEEAIPDPTLRDEVAFSELSLRGGVSWAPVPTTEIYAGYGEGFLPPTAEELFAFPFFGSNADLKPEDARSYELGMRWTATGLRGALALFRTDTNDEIVFDPDSGLGPYGANVNAGKTRRRGVEASVRALLGRRVEGFFNAAMTRAEFQGSPHRGKKVPLVPDERFAGGVDASLPAGFSIHADALYVGRQVLDNDDANEQATLPPYAVVNVLVSWGRPLANAPSRRERGPTLFAQVLNLLDRQYATRGIHAYDVSTFRNETFLTPAPGRRYLAGITWAL